MQQIKDTLSEAAGNVGDFAGQAGDNIQQLAGSEEMKKLLPYLLAGGTAATAGGLLTSKRRAKKGESRTSHLGRVLGNALMAGGLAAGSTALIRKGMDSASDASPKLLPDGSKVKDEGPLETTMRDVAFSPLTAAGAGAAGLGLTRGWAGLGAGDKIKADDMANLLTKLETGGEAVNESDLRGFSPQKIQQIVDRAGAKLGQDLHGLRGRAGIAAGGPGIMGAIKGYAEHAGRSGPMGTFGQTWPRRGGRAAVGLTAAAIPALLGSILTKEKTETDA